MNELPAADTRVFLFRSPNASGDPTSAMDPVNAWLGKDRSNAQYPDLKIADITIVPDDQGGVYTLIVCNLGKPKETGE